jgi:hypothetical protein
MIDLIDPEAVVVGGESVRFGRTLFVAIIQVAQSACLAHPRRLKSTGKTMSGREELPLSRRNISSISNEKKGFQLIRPNHQLSGEKMLLLCMAIGYSGCLRPRARSRCLTS